MGAVRCLGLFRDGLAVSGRNQGHLRSRRRHRQRPGGVIGSLGLLPSACIGPHKGYVEPAHGSAPDIAGQDVANPYAMIGAVALMFDRCLGLLREASDIWKALFSVFEEGYHTKDLAAPHISPAQMISTTEFGNIVARKIL